MPNVTKLLNAILPEQVQPLGTVNEYLRCVFASPEVEELTRQIFGIL
jgi:hypothetical protein